MTIPDATLNRLLASLAPSERAVVEEHLAGRRSDEAQVILRWLRKKLKGKARRGKRRR